MIEPRCVHAVSVTWLHIIIIVVIIIKAIESRVFVAYVGSGKSHRTDRTKFSVLDESDVRDVTR